jgi:hypothetical protein
MLTVVVCCLRDRLFIQVGQSLSGEDVTMRAQVPVRPGPHRSGVHGSRGASSMSCGPPIEARRPSRHSALFGALHDVEGEVAHLQPDELRRIRHTKDRPAADALHRWLVAHRRRCTTEVGQGQGDRLQPPALGSAYALHRRRLRTCKYQRGGEPNPADFDWAQQMAVRGGCCAPGPIPENGPYPGKPDHLN